MEKVSDPTKVSIALDGTPGNHFVEADEPPAVKVVELPEAPSSPPPAHEFIGIARQMCAEARERFFQAALPIAIDARLRDFAWALLSAIGEVSPEEALDALRRHGGEPPADIHRIVGAIPMTAIHDFYWEVEKLWRGAPDSMQYNARDLAIRDGIIKLFREARADTGARQTSPDVVCEHGTALDVHCCNCHSGFIFDKNHECPEPAAGK